MELYKSLITPQEAVRLFGSTSVETVTRGVDIMREYIKQRPNDSDAMYYILGCVWNAGRIQGIREERARRKCQASKLRLGISPVDVVNVGGRTLPMFQMDGFFDTDEGYRLYRQCMKTGDMRPYRAAREAWRVARADAGKV